MRFCKMVKASYESFYTRSIHHGRSRPIKDYKSSTNNIECSHSYSSIMNTN